MTGRRIRDNKLTAAALAFGVYTLIMAEPERRMRANGGPGIIPFELAGNASRAEDIISKWGDGGQLAARISLWLDFGYMATYGSFVGLLVERARRRWGHPRVLTATVIAAVAGDAIEGISLLKVLDRTRVAVHARRAKIAAVTKFVVLTGALGYVAAERLSSAARTS
jgi:hypothetical protein